MQVLTNLVADLVVNKAVAYLRKNSIMYRLPWKELKLHEPRGQWSIEPDELEWFDYATGLKCRMGRNAQHAWCGYLHIPKMWVTSPDTMFDEFNVHGGVTYKSYNTIEDAWVVGFDCGHDGDMSPLEYHREANTGYAYMLAGVYRDVAYVKEQLRCMALQAAAFCGMPLAHTERRHHEDSQNSSAAFTTTAVFRVCPTGD